MTTEELLPCPFCGSNDIVLSPRDGTYDQVVCLKCDAQITSHQAKKDWNRRARLTESAPGVEGRGDVKINGATEKSAGSIPKATPPAATDGFVRVPREVVEWIVNDGDGREVFPDDSYFPNSPCPAFKALQQSLLAAAPQSGKKEDWISVKERLPDDGDIVLVSSGRATSLASFHHFDSGSRFEFEWFKLCDPIVEWRPIPAPSSPPSKAEGET